VFTFLSRARAGSLCDDIGDHKCHDEHGCTGCDTPTAWCSNQNKTEAKDLPKMLIPNGTQWLLTAISGSGHDCWRATHCQTSATDRCDPNNPNNYDWHCTEDPNAQPGDWQPEYERVGTSYCIGGGT
jgi:hypothetical protein